MPADGAFIYVFEYRDGVAAPERSGELRLAPATAWECMGVRRMVRWSQDGRVLQAHVFLGARAPERLEEEARSILSSIRVE